MKRTFVKYLSGILLLWESLKGTKTVREVKHPSNTLGQLVGYSVAGYKLEIYCQRKHYRRSYDKWFIPNKDHMAYRVFSVVSQDAPDSLKKACELDIDIPALLPLAIDDHGHRQAAVNAYLDILIARLGEEVFRNS
jgi:hypothetical protein